MENQFKWKNINWQKVKLAVAENQEKIYKASKEKNLKKVHMLQLELLRNFDAKLLAVRRATEIFKSQQPSVPISHTQKALLVLNLTIDSDGCSTGSSLECLSALEQPAKQLLAKQALEPQWEAIFESNSYSLKTNHYDLVQKILSSFKTKPQWVFRIDFSNFAELALSSKKILTKLATFPEMEKQIQHWLKQGLWVDFEKRPDSLCQFLQGQSLNCFSDFLIKIIK